MNSNAFADSQDSISGETLTLGRIQTYSFSIAFINYSKKLVKGIQQIKVSLWGGAHMQTVIDLHQIQRIHIH